MSYFLEYDAYREVVRARLAGKVDSSIISEFAKDLAHMLLENNCLRLINDAREIRLDLSTIDIVDIPRVIQAEGIGTECKRALVVSELSSDVRFFEDVTYNRG